MNEIMPWPASPVEQAPPTLFEWQPNIERLREEAKAARAAGRPDPWAVVEAECWIDLIDAELAAERALDQSRPEVRDSIARLMRWRTELQLIVGQLKALDN